MDTDDTSEDDDPESDDGNGSSLSDIADRLASTGESSADTSGTDDSDTQSSSAYSFSDMVEALESDEGSPEWDSLAQSPTPYDGRESQITATLNLVGSAHNVLFVGPANTAAEYDLSSRLLRPQDEEGLNLVLVIVDDQPERQLQLYQGYLPDGITRLTLVTTQNIQQSDAVDNLREFTDEISFVNISSRSDLRRLGIVVSKQLSEWEQLPEPDMLYLHSVSKFLDVIDDNQLLFRFLHILSNRVKGANATAYYQFDPNHHDAAVLSMLEPLFDNILEYDSEGALSVR
jgi:hypothetical protein